MAVGIIQGMNDEVVARERFRKNITDILFQASTFVVDDRAFMQFEADQFSAISERLRRSEESGNYKLLAEIYAEENDNLKASLKDKIDENNILKNNNQALNVALRSKEYELKSIDSSSESQELPPESVAEALEISRKILNGKVIFSNGIDDSIKTLNPTAGPPDKILRYLKTLGDLSDALSLNNTLGMHVSAWLKKHGVECSSESETVK